ncbi:hypothetical protein SBOR_1780 [Sclerotinia borealis F-4128]|uniref:Uncharacterized protein n=1 Tax=Sclerotinia borealis (strain F-4128) TaxID=1432307 RepID=W9CTN4_SCLBF|nr:hypothetical protein SBOR_1780 [Sclerotinia borealis F-4128]
MNRPVLGLDYARLNIPVLDQKYPRWNDLFDTMNFDDRGSLRRILQAARSAETFHPFNLKLTESATLSDAEMTAVRDLSYAFNRNHLCRDMVRHLMLFSRHDDEQFTLENEAKFYTEVLKKVDLSPVRQPKVYLQVRREFRRLAPDLDDLDENRAAAELDRWASWEIPRFCDNMEVDRRRATETQHDGVVHVQDTTKWKNDREVVRVENNEEAEIIESAKILMSMSMERGMESPVVTSVAIPQIANCNKRKSEEPDDESNNNKVASCNTTKLQETSLDTAQIICTLFHTIHSNRIIILSISRQQTNFFKRLNERATLPASRIFSSNKTAKRK